MIEQAINADDFSFPTISNHDPQTIHHDFAASFWRSTRKVADCSSPVSTHGGAKHSSEEDFEFQPETHPTKDFSMDRLWEPGEGTNRIDDLQREFQVSLSARSSTSYSTSNPVIGDDGGKCFLVEDKMDMLWEDFNDEFDRISGDNQGEKSIIGSESDTDAAEMGEFCCVQALKISKTSSLPLRRPSLQVIVKVLKKLFLFQNSHLAQKNKASLMY